MKLTPELVSSKTILSSLLTNKTPVVLSIYECDFELPVNLAGIHNISVTATDPWGAFTEIIYSLEVLSLPADGTNISDEFIGEWISKKKIEKK